MVIQHELHVCIRMQFFSITNIKQRNTYGLLLQDRDELMEGSFVMHLLA